MSYQPINNWEIIVKSENYLAEICTVFGLRHLNYLRWWLEERFENNQSIKENFQIYLCHNGISHQIIDISSLSDNSIYAVWGDRIKFDDNSFYHPHVSINDNGTLRYSNLPSGGFPNIDGLIEPFPPGYEPKTKQEVLAGLKIRYSTHSKFMTEVFDKAFEVRPEVHRDVEIHNWVENYDLDEDL